MTDNLFWGLTLLAGLGIWLAVTLLASVIAAALCRAAAKTSPMPTLADRMRAASSADAEDHVRECGRRFGAAS